MNAREMRIYAVGYYHARSNGVYQDDAWYIKDLRHLYKHGYEAGIADYREEDEIANMDWRNTKAEWDGEDWVFTGVPPEAGWLSGQTCFSPHELGDCDTPEQAIQALKSWVSKD